MAGVVAMLCVDSFSARYPRTLGLPPEAAEQADWLTVTTAALEARMEVESCPDLREVWVAGSDDMEAINLAAALKRDLADSATEVYLVTEDRSGEVPLHAQAANLDGMLGYDMLSRRYADRRAEALGFGGVAVQAPALPAAPAGRLGMLLPVVSATGGAGKSTVAVLAALDAARRGLKTLLIDGDFQFGDMADILGYYTRLRDERAPLHGFDEVLDGALQPEVLAGYDPAAQGHIPHLTLLAALQEPQRAEECNDVFGGFVEQVLPLFDVVVVNTGSAWTEVQAVLAEMASRVIYVIDQRPAALRAAGKALALCAKCGIATGSFLMALNRCGKGAVYSKIDVGCVLGNFEVAELAEGGLEVEELMAAGNPGGLSVARNPMALSVTRMMDDLLEGKAPSQGRNDAAGLAGTARRLMRWWKREEEPCPF